MSNFSTAHTVTRFDSKKSQALSGQRLAKVGYKTTAKTPAKFPSVCASVPFLGNDAISENIPALMGHIRGMLENAQDGVLRSLYESSGGTLTHVTDSDLSIAACIGFLDAESQGSRLTKEFIESWFSDSVQEYLVAIIAEKLGYDGELSVEQDATIARHVNGYKGLYSSLAGGKTMLQDNQINSLRKVLELIDSDDTSVKLLARLNAMQNKPKMEELLEL
jgi:hypothetical protein